jgi:hypothetical protein
VEAWLPLASAVGFKEDGATPTSDELTKFETLKKQVADESCPAPLLSIVGSPGFKAFFTALAKSYEVSGKGSFDKGHFSKLLASIDQSIAKAELFVADDASNVLRSYWGVRLNACALLSGITLQASLCRSSADSTCPLGSFGG